MNVKELVQLGDSLFHTDERHNIERQWSDIAEFMLPSQFNLFNVKESPGDKKTRRLFDSTAIQANHDLAAAIHSTLTNPASQWSKMKYKDPILNQSSEAIMWLEDTNNRIHDALNESNFYTELAKSYQAFTSLGTMVLLQEDAAHGGSRLFQGFRFKSEHMGEVAIAENADADVDTYVKRFKLTAKAAMERFGDKVSDDIKKAIEQNKPFDKFEFMHVVLPRDKKDVKMNDNGLAAPKNRPFMSKIIEKKAMSVVEESGYYEFAPHSVRWQTMPGEVYGRSPGHIALPDTRTLNKLTELTLLFTEKVVNPPILAAETGVVGNLTLKPGHLSIVKRPDAIVPFTPQGRPDIASFKTEELKESIRNTFFLNKIFLPDRTEIGEMTATETLRRIEQTQKVLGSTWGALNQFLSNIVVRSFKMMLRGNALAPMPPIVAERGVNVDIAFINSLARAQQADDISNIETWVQGIAFLSQIKPEVLDIIDGDAVARHIAKIRGVPELAQHSEAEVQAQREERAELQQQQLALQTAQQGADIMSKVGGLGGGDIE